VKRGHGRVGGPGGGIIAHGRHMHVGGPGGQSEAGRNGGSEDRKRTEERAHTPASNSRTRSRTDDLEPRT